MQFQTKALIVVLLISFGPIVMIFTTNSAVAQTKSTTAPQKIREIVFDMDSSPTHMQSFKGNQDIESICLQLCGQELTDLSLFTTMPKLKRLDLWQVTVHEEPFGQLAKCSELRWLTLPDCRSSPRDAEPFLQIGKLRRCERLSVLIIGCNLITDDRLQVIGQLKTLQVLGWCHGIISDAGVESLRGLSNLKTLHIEGDINDEGLRSLANCGALQHLLLDGNRITETGLAELQKLKSLKILRLGMSNELTDADFAQLLKIESLEELGIDASKLPSDRLGSLRKLPRLKHLTLYNPKLDLKSTYALRGINSLESLSLCDAVFNDAAIGELAKFKSLKSLFVESFNRPTMSAEQKSRLKAGLVHLQDHDSERKPNRYHDVVNLGNSSAKLRCHHNHSVELIMD